MSERAEDLWRRIDEIGQDAIDEFIEERATEYLFLDFKRSANDGKAVKLVDDDRNNLAKAISGFGNSEGGLIVWGVECSKDSSGADVASAKHPLADAKRFVSLLEGAVSGRTVPPHKGVRSRAVEVGGGPSGFAVTLIPATENAPLQALPAQRYYMEAERASRGRDNLTGCNACFSVTTRPSD